MIFQFAFRITGLKERKSFYVTHIFRREGNFSFMQELRTSSLIGFLSSVHQLLRQKVIPAGPQVLLHEQTINIDANHISLPP